MTERCEYCQQYCEDFHWRSIILWSPAIRNALHYHDECFKIASGITFDKFKHQYTMQTVYGAHIAEIFSKDWIKFRGF